MDRIERVSAVIEGRRPDRPPVGLWHHFPPDQVSGRAAVRAHLDHVKAYDLDFLKVMNDQSYPHAEPLRSAADLAGLEVLGGDEPEFTRQLELIAALKRELGGRMWMTTTVFNAYATLRRLVKGQPTQHRPPNMEAGGDADTATILRWLEADSAAVKSAIGKIATSLANFAGRCLAAGADGIFMSVRDDWLDAGREGPSLYDELVREADLAILRAAAGAPFNMLHVCGKAVNFRAFAAYPVQVLNWADRSAGPGIGEVCGWVKPAICAGVDNLSTLPNAAPEDCAGEVADALARARDRPIMIGPGCTFDPVAVPRANLEAVCRAAHGT